MVFLFHRLHISLHKLTLAQNHNPVCYIAHKTTITSMLYLEIFSNCIANDCKKAYFIARDLKLLIYSSYAQEDSMTFDRLLVHLLR